MPCPEDLPLPYALAQAARERAVKARRRKLARARRAAAVAAAGIAGQDTRAGYVAAASDAATPALHPMAQSPTQKVGARGEDAARRYLEGRGLTILGQNLHMRGGEVDLVADDRGTLVFVEVRFRRSTRHGGAAGSVSTQKQARLARAAQAWLPTLSAQCYGGRTPPCRFDVVTLDDASQPEDAALDWVKGAFLIT